MMPRSLVGLALVAVFFLSLPWSGVAQSSSAVIIPPSSLQRPEDLGISAHTNFWLPTRPAAESSDTGAPTPETPASLACVYKLTKQVKGCPISGTTQVPTGGAKAIAIVSAYDNPDAKTDLDIFSQQFGLASADFTQVYADGKQPPNDPGGWSLEEALAIEWAHAMAPKAQIYLVEAASNSYSDLFQAESVASELVAKAGGGEVSNSWGGVEFSGEQSYDNYFKTKGVVYFAAAGSPTYPSTSPNVVSAGGTTVERNSKGDFTGESGCCVGGDSIYEPRPAYQNIIEKIVGQYRGTPDLSFDAGAQSPVSVYDADGGYGWIAVAGTSVSAPSLAGIVNAAGSFASSTKAELTMIYKEYGIPKEYHAWFRDITSGSGCTTGWDLCSGVGSVLTYKGK